MVSSPRFADGAAASRRTLSEKQIAARLPESGGARRTRRTHFSEQIREASISSLGFAPRLAGFAI